MKRFSQLMPAGVPVEFDYPARSFTLLSCITPVDVRFGTGSQTQEVAEGMTPGLWYEAETPFRKVVITSQVDQMVSFLVSMGRSGWNQPPVTTEKHQLLIDGMAASATIHSPTIDLGDEWGSCLMHAFFAGTASAGAVLAIVCGDQMGGGASLPRAASTGGTGTAYIVTGSSTQTIGGARPIGRYVALRFINGATIQSGPSNNVIFQVHRNVTA